MTRDEGVALIKQHLAMKTTLDAAIVTQMQLAQTTLERARTKPWFLEFHNTSLVTVASTRSISLPSGFIVEKEEDTMLLTDSDGNLHEVSKEELSVLKHQFLTSDAGIPEFYALVGSTIEFYPLPDDAYSLDWTYYKADDVLTSNIENAWLREVPLLLLGSAGQMIAAGPVRDNPGAAVFAAWIQLGKDILSTHNTDREVRGRVLQMGGASS